uniref:Uncharacterized protein n=1 Tax=Anopheles maculatus TaxID=74869 RepID=A0A182SPJ9_9DIPT
MFRELLFVVIVMDLGALHSQTTLCNPLSSNSTSLFQYRPFEFCSKVAEIRSPLIDYMKITVPQLSSSCMISCVKRTQRAVLIEVVNCSSDEEFIPGLFFERMNFAVCLSDAEIILHGYDSSYWIEFTFTPDVDCLRTRMQTMCTRIFNYSMKYAQKQLMNGVRVGELSINLDKHIWRVLARNRACHISIGTPVPLLLYGCIIACALHTHFVRYERLLL